MKLDYNIYGQDETATAADIAADGLTPGAVDGAVIGGSKAALGGGGDAKVSTGDVKASHAGCSSDSRARTAGNHGKQG